MPEISESAAHQQVAQLTSCWMSLQLGDKGCSFDVLYDAVLQSKELADPFISAYILEGIDNAQQHGELVIT